MIICIGSNSYAQDFTQYGLLTSANGGVTTEDLNKDNFPDILFLNHVVDIDIDDDGDDDVVVGMDDFTEGFLVLML